MQLCIQCCLWLPTDKFTFKKDRVLNIILPILVLEKLLNIMKTAYGLLVPQGGSIRLPLKVSSPLRETLECYPGTYQSKA